MLKKRREKTNPKGLALSSSKGLTLIELLVSMFIMGLMIGVVVYNHKNFVDNLEITNLAYAMALSIREAQIAGISVKIDPENNFSSAFGVHFNINDKTSSFRGNDKAFLTFADLNESEHYDEVHGFYSYFDCDIDNNEECVSVKEIGRGNYIYNICYRGTTANMTCSTSIKGVDITFLRPKPDANTRFRDKTGKISTTHNDKEAIICLKSPEGRTKSVHVLKTGQISVRNEECSS